MMWDWNGWGWWWWILMPLMMVGFWGVVAWVVVTALRNDRGTRGVPPGRETGSPAAKGEPAERILAERFARGEIDADEYRRSLDVLRGGSGDRAA
jgi:putative membrane protein